MFGNIYSKKRVLGNDDYMLWLKQFSTVYPCFCHDDWAYNEEEISSLDKKNLAKLNKLFEDVMDYAEYNNIEADVIDHEISYKLSYDGIGFVIGVIIGQGSINFCQVVPYLDTQDFISAEDIINDIHMNYISNNKLLEISDTIDILIGSGLSSNEIYDIIDNKLNDNNLPKELVQIRKLKK